MSEDSSEATNLLDTAIISYETSGNAYQNLFFLRKYCLMKIVDQGFKTYILK